MKLLKTALLLTIASGLMLPDVSSAQEPSVYETKTPVQKRKESDAAVDRNIIMTSAETVSAGDVTFNDYELILAGFTFGITDNVQVTATTLLPIVKDIPFWLTTSAKWRLLHSERVVFSLQPSASIGHQSDVTVGALGLGFLLDLVLDDEGKFVVSFNESNYWGFGGTDDTDLDMADGVVFQIGVGANYRVHKYIKLMLEFAFHGGIINGDGEILEEATLINYGVRFCSKTISVDLAFLRPLHPDVGEYFVMGYPFVAFSARF